MVAFYYSTKVAFVKGSPNVVAANSTVLVYDTTDTGYTTPILTYSDPALTTIVNLVSDAYGIVPDFYTDNKANILWKSGTMKGQWGTDTSRAGERGPSGADGAPGATGPQGPAGVDGAGSNADVAAYIPVSGPTRDALDARYPAKTRVDSLEATAVLTGDARLLDASADVEGILFSVTDQNDKRTALEIGLDGDLTPYAAGRVAGSIGVAEASLDTGQTFAVVDADDRIIFSNTSTPDFPSLDWAHWGDSLTDNLITGVDAWVTQLSALTGRNHFNGGWYQQRSENIAARQGGLPALVTVSGNVTASSGTTTITAIINKPVLQSTTRSVHGTLAGVPGIIQEAVTDTVTFTPDIPGAYPVPAKSMFAPTNGETYRDRTVTIWAGRNSIYDTDPQIIVAAIRAMIDYLTPRVKRVIVMEIPPFTTDSSGTRTLTAAVNTAIKAAFPAYWLDIASWLRTTAAATAASITFTTQDNTDIANGDTPTSFRSDNGHLNATGCTAVAYRVYQEAQKRGWL